MSSIHQFHWLSCMGAYLCLFGVFNEFQISPGFVKQLHWGNTVEIQPQATKVSHSGPQGPPTLHQWWDTGSNPGEECHLLDLSGRGADFHFIKATEVCITGWHSRRRAFLWCFLYWDAVRETEAPAHPINMQWHDLPHDLFVDIRGNALC